MSLKSITGIIILIVLTIFTMDKLVLHNQLRLEAVWVPGEQLGATFSSIEENDGDDFSKEGIDQHVISCSIVPEEQTMDYEVLFDNPYSESIIALVGLSIDSETSGTIWGWYLVTIPPTESALATFSTDKLTMDELTYIFDDTLTEIEQWGKYCSIQFAGFIESKFVIDTKKPLASLAYR